MTFVSVGALVAAPVTESGDFGNTFATQTNLGGANPVYGGVDLNTGDIFDHFRLTGYSAGQTIRITLTQIAALPSTGGDSSASASDDGGATASASDSGSDASSSDGGSTASASGSSNPTDALFTIHLLDNAGSFLSFAGDSGPDLSGGDASASASGDASASASDDGSSASASGTASEPSYPDGDVFGIRSFAFDFDAMALPTGELNFRIGYDGPTSAFYEVTATAQSSAAVPEPSAAVPLVAGAAGLGFLAARRRRRGK